MLLFNISPALLHSQRVQILRENKASLIKVRKRFDIYCYNSIMQTINFHCSDQIDVGSSSTGIDGWKSRSTTAKADSRQR